MLLLPYLSGGWKCVFWLLQQRQTWTWTFCLPCCWKRKTWIHALYVTQFTAHALACVTKCRAVTFSITDAGVSTAAWPINIKVRQTELCYFNRAMKSEMLCVVMDLYLSFLWQITKHISMFYKEDLLSGLHFQSLKKCDLSCIWYFWMSL